MDRNYKGVIWTNHAIQRMRERGIKQGDAWVTFRRPDRSRYAKKKGVHVYYRTWGDQKIEVVATQNEKREWVIVSVWSKYSAGEKKERGKDKSKSPILKIIHSLFSKT